MIHFFLGCDPWLVFQNPYAPAFFDPGIHPARALGLALCWLQQEFGLISMGSSAGSFIVEAYPVSVHVGDLVIVFLTVLVVGWAAVWWPVRYLSRRLL